MTAKKAFLHTVQSHYCHGRTEADGTKLKRFIVFPGAKRETKQLNEQFKNKWCVASSVNGCMKEGLTHDWVQEVL